MTVKELKEILNYFNDEDVITINGGMYPKQNRMWAELCADGEIIIDERDNPHQHEFGNTDYNIDEPGLW